MVFKQVIEALVFASPKPISTQEIAAALKSAAQANAEAEAQEFAKAREPEITAALGELQSDLGESGRAFQLVERANGWTFVSDPGCAAWVRQLYPEAKPTRLTGPQLETLAIIAYRQPVTRADIEAVRGVSVDGVMQVLLDRGLVKIAGRAELPGRPLLYSTTEYFLEHFGLKNTDELPNASELKRVPLPTAATAAPEPPPPSAEIVDAVAEVIAAGEDAAPEAPPEEPAAENDSVPAADDQPPVSP
jgi:segregation and condensation protein B